MGTPRSIVILLLAITACAPGILNAQTPPPVYAVLFTHIEDTTPGGTLGSAQSRQNYLVYRNGLIAMANLARDHGVPWSLQPDWKILQAALLYEDASLTGNTLGKNFLRYLKEDLGVVIDPHSHESGGYNYTDVAHLLDSLGVGGSTVIGGHIWDPSLPQFAEWDRYRVPVPGEQFPGALWRGDILMGSGTPNHVDDPVVSGVWRPRDRDHYFEDDSTGNMVAIGQYTGGLDDAYALRSSYQSGAVPIDVMLTTSFHIRPSTIVAPGGITSIEDTIITPIVAMRDSGLLIATDFTRLVATWRTTFGSRGFLYDARDVSGVQSDRALARPGVVLGPFAPNPFTSETIVSFTVSRATRVRIAMYDVSGRERAVLVDGERAPGRYSVRWPARDLESGVYICRAFDSRAGQGRATEVGRKLVITH